MQMNDYEFRHNAALRAFGADCTVLLRTDGSFPLERPGQIALYGSGARRTVQGGTGSGEVNSRVCVSIEQGLEQAGFTVTTKAWLDSYDGIYTAAHQAFIRDIKAKARAKHTMAITEGMGAVMPEPDYDLPLDGAGDIALYVLARISGEGSDRQPVPGDILLTETEKRDILCLQQRYARFMLVLNVGGVVDLSPLGAVQNILLLSQLGAMTGHVLADLVLGKSCPSGKLAATWAAWGQYADIGTFGEQNDTRYKEGVYVGYRYFDSVGKKPLFPFGYGLGYTTFAVTPGTVQVEGQAVSVTASVRNTGSRPGKQTVQAYVSVPAGRLDQPSQTLAGWAKSALLAPGEETELCIRFDLADLAGYDSAVARYLLEAGDYVLRLGTSSADTAPVAILRLEREVTVLQARPCCGTPDFTDWRPDALCTAPLPPDLPVHTVAADAFVPREVVYDCPAPIERRVRVLRDKELAWLGIGGFDPKGGLLSVVGNASTQVAGAAGETTCQLRSKNVPPLVMSDGPAGLRLSPKFYRDKKGVHAVGATMPATMAELLPAPVRWLQKHTAKKPPKGTVLEEQYASALPIGTAIAQSWDTELAARCGDIVGDEMERFGVHLWLAPALNIQRDIRCGRNFEYFSEDPLLSGRMAAALTNGVQAHSGRGTTVKHFAANNQETNRYCSNSQISERALREIYLRGFGICVREAQPKTVMTSYNLLNGTHTSENRELIEDILRAEFGFTGVVMTDWVIAGMSDGKGNLYPGASAERVAAAGGDLFMPGSKADFDKVLAALKDGTLERDQLRRNATRVLRLIKELTAAK